MKNIKLDFKNLLENKKLLMISRLCAKHSDCCFVYTYILAVIFTKILASKNYYPHFIDEELLERVRILLK